MRYIDIAVAALIGLAAITGEFALSPWPADAMSVSLASRSGLRDSLLTIVELKGTTWLLISSFSQMCDYLDQLSNSTVTFTATIGSQPCANQPGPGYMVAVLDFPLKPRPVELEAWQAAQG